MPCNQEDAVYICHIFKAYCTAFGYHGEMCRVPIGNTGTYDNCPHWQDTPEDLAFKARIELSKHAVVPQYNWLRLKGLKVYDYEV